MPETNTEKQPKAPPVTQASFIAPSGHYEGETQFNNPNEQEEAQPKQQTIDAATDWNKMQQAFVDDPLKRPKKPAGKNQQSITSPDSSIEPESPPTRAGTLKTPPIFTHAQATAPEEDDE